MVPVAVSAIMFLIGVPHVIEYVKTSIGEAGCGRGLSCYCCI